MLTFGFHFKVSPQLRFAGVVGNGTPYSIKGDNVMAMNFVVSVFFKASSCVLYPTDEKIRTAGSFSFVIKNSPLSFVMKDLEAPFTVTEAPAKTLSAFVFTRPLISIVCENAMDWLVNSSMAKA
jgi:hypothetical protein